MALTPLQATGSAADRRTMRRLLVFTTAIAAALTLAGPAGAAGSSSIAALQVALHAHGFYPAAVDGVQGPLTTTGLTNFQRVKGIPATGLLGPKTRSALGPLGRPLLGQRELAVGAVGWDVSSLEFRLIPYGLDPKAVDGRFTAATAGALARFQAKRQLTADGVAGKLTYRALAGRTVSAGSYTPPTLATHVVAAGESFFSISERYGVSPLLLAKENGLELSTRDRPRSAAGAAGGAAQRPNAGGTGADGDRATRCAHRSTAGRPPTASTRGSRARRPGWSRVPAGRRLQRRRDRRDAAPARNLGMGRPDAARHDAHREPTTATSVPASATSAGCSTSSTAIAGSRSPATTRAPRQCATAACSRTRSATSRSSCKLYGTV